MLAACLLTPELIQGRELVWFIDNEAALSSLIRGTSRAEDVSHIAACTQVAMLEGWHLTEFPASAFTAVAVSYTHLRAHET